jgi:hypothetical protein
MAGVGTTSVRRTCIAIATGTRYISDDKGLTKTIPAIVCGKPAVLTVKASVPGGMISGGACGMAHLAVVQSIVNAEATRLNANAGNPNALPKMEHGPRGLRGSDATLKR